MVVRVGIKLALIRRRRRHRHRDARRVRVSLMTRQPVDGWIGGTERPQHVIERAVLHHQHNDVLKVLDSWERAVEHKASWRIFGCVAAES